MSSFYTKIILATSLLLSLTYLTQAQFTPKWDGGLKVESEDKNVKIKFGGRIQYDMAFFVQSDSLEANFGEITNGAEFRRARFYSKGTFFKNVSYKMQLDFAAGRIVFKDVYLEFLKIPIIGSLRVGHFKEPLRFSSLMSSNNLVFMERPNFESFSEDRNSGLLIKNSYKNHKFGWQLGAFRNSSNAGDSPASNDEIDLTGRITSLVINNKEKREILHLGIGATYRNPKLNNYIVKVRPPAHLAPKYLTTNIIDDVEDTDIVNLEVVYSRGRFTAQSEYLYAQVNAIKKYNFKAYYAQVSFILTGEQRPYKGSYSGLTKVTPNKNFGEDGGKGAWEVGLRYSAMDLDDNGLEGGTMNSVTAALNWYLNPAVVIKFNYVYSFMTEENTVHIAQMRFQVVF